MFRVVAQLCDSIDALMNIDPTSTSSSTTATGGGEAMTISDGQSDPETVTMMRVDDMQASGGDRNSSISKFVVLIAATNK